jgi:hypothetical protein
MGLPTNQGERERVYRLIDIVNGIKAGSAQGLPLSNYLPREIADALQSLIASAVAHEREECALVAESASEPAGAIGPGEQINAEPQRRGVCLEIAASIRQRR